MRELEQLLADLEPPAYGLERLQRSLAARRPRTKTSKLRWRWAIAAACVPIAMMAVWIPQWIAQHQRTAALVEALNESLSPPVPAGGIRVAGGAAVELPSGQANVKLYLVQSAGPGPHRP